MFATEFGTTVNPRNLLRAVELAARKAGIEDVGAHSMRHSAAVDGLGTALGLRADVRRGFGTWFGYRRKKAPSGTSESTFDLRRADRI